MTDVATWAVEDAVGILTIYSPPVNALGLAVRKGLSDGIAALNADPAVQAIVLICGGRTFFAGADIAEFGKPFLVPTLIDVLAELEASAKPVVAAIHGTALGGGLETALVCGYRIAVPSAKSASRRSSSGCCRGLAAPNACPDWLVRRWLWT